VTDCCSWVSGFPGLSDHAFGTDDLRGSHQDDAAEGKHAKPSIRIRHDFAQKKTRGTRESRGNREDFEQPPLGRSLRGEFDAEFHFLRPIPGWDEP
jgi:hypothetical protein